MKLIRLGTEALPTGFKCVATIGNFDGVHLGHQAVLEALRNLSQHHTLPTMVITFEPTPLEFFLEEKAPRRIMAFREKFAALQGLGVDVLCVLRFNRAMASLSPECFIQSILVNVLGVQHLVVGEDFRFGNDRVGDVHLLQQEGERLKFLVSVLPELMLEGKKISSTRVREALRVGKLEDVKKLLGRL